MNDNNKLRLKSSLTDEDDDVAARSAQHLAGPGSAHRFQRRFIAGDQDGSRGNVADELQRRDCLQQGRVPVAVAVGLLKVLSYVQQEKKRLSQIACWSSKPLTSCKHFKDENTAKTEEDCIRFHFINGDVLIFLNG